MLSADGLRLFFTSQRGGNGVDIYVSNRANMSESFTTATPLTAVNTTPGSEQGAFLAADGSELWFARNQGSEARILRAPKSGLSFSTPVAVPELTTAKEGWPVLSSDGLTIYFGRATGLDWDIWVAHRTTAATAFDPPSALVDVNTAGDDHPGWLSPDNCRLYFASERPDGIGHLDIYMVERAP